MKLRLLNTREILMKTMRKNKTLSNKMTKFTITIESSRAQKDMRNVRILPRKFIRLQSFSVSWCKEILSLGFRVKDSGTSLSQKRQI